MSIKLKSKTNSNIFIATTDVGDYILHSDLIVSAGIHKGEVEDKKFLQAVSDSEVLIGTGVAMKYLGSRLKTEKGLREYLSKKEYSKSSIDKIINKLLDYSILNDRAYAESYIKSNPKYSKMKLRDKLREKGVSRDLIDELTEDIDEADSCEANSMKYLKNKTLDDQTTQKLIRHLLGKGYKFDTINSTIRKLQGEK